MRRKESERKLKTRVINIRSKEPYDEYIGRGSKWGNPFVVGVHGTREECIEKYDDHLYRTGLIHDIEELRGKVLACFCKPKACHGDVLVKALEY